MEGGFRAFWTVDAIVRHSETRGVVGSGGPEAPGCLGGSRGAAGMGKATREASHAFVGSCQRPESTRSLQVPSGGMGWKMEPRWEAQLGTSYRSARVKRPVPGPECGGPRCGQCSQLHMTPPASRGLGARWSGAFQPGGR